MTTTTEQRIELRQHPLSAAFPSMQPDEIESLAGDIERNGQREPGVMLDGMVLDGWHRYLACEKVDQPFKAVQFDGADPVAFVLSKNLHRRHLTASQRAAAVVAASEWHPGGNRAPGARFKTNGEMAEAAEVSERTIKHAKAAQEAGLGEAVRNGDVSAKQGAEVAKLPAAKRAKAVRAIKEGQPPTPKQEKKPAADAAKAHAELIDVQGKYADLLEKHSDLSDKLDEMTALAETAKAFEEKIEFKEMQVLRIELKSCKRRRDDLMRENAELKKECARWKKKAEKK